MSFRDDKYAPRYAKALLEALLETRETEAAIRIREDLEKVQVLARGEAGAFFGNPTFLTEEKEAVLEAIIKKHAIDSALKGFLKVLISLRQIHLLPDVLREFEKGLRDLRGEVRVEVKSAVELTDEERDQIRAALARALQKDVVVEASVDSELLGGVVARVGSVVYDASVKTQLGRMLENL